LPMAQWGALRLAQDPSFGYTAAEITTNTDGGFGSPSPKSQTQNIVKEDRVARLPRSDLGPPTVRNDLQ
jgi:hypothetical protein